MEVKLCIEDLVLITPLYSLYFIEDDGWYVFNKTTHEAVKFPIGDFTYLDVLNYVDSIEG